MVMLGGFSRYSFEHHSSTEWEQVMAKCETCGNDYDKAFQVCMNGTTHTFDSFECAIHALAPTCDNCGIHILGHGLEKEGTFFCCDHCAEAKGVTGLRDRIGAGGVIEMGSRV
jgi:formate dehydrogenase maturation protein FdhE